MVATRAMSYDNKNEKETVEHVQSIDPASKGEGKRSKTVANVSATSGGLWGSTAPSRRGVADGQAEYYAAVQTSDIPRWSKESRTLYCGQLSLKPYSLASLDLHCAAVYRDQRLRRLVDDCPDRHGAVPADIRVRRERR